MHQGGNREPVSLCGNKNLPPPVALGGCPPPLPSLLSHLILNFFDFSGGRMAPQTTCAASAKVDFKVTPSQRRQIKLQIHLRNAISVGKFNSIRTNESLSRRLG